MRTYLLLASLTAAACLPVVGCSETAAPDPSATDTAAIKVGDLCDKGESCNEIARGRNAFFDTELDKFGGGNGRACATCHDPDKSFQLAPADVEARYQALQAAKAADPTADDPLFRDIDFDIGPGGVPYGNLRQNGLVKINFTLPANIRRVSPPGPGAPLGGDLPDGDKTSVWRSTPSVQNVASSGPDGSTPIWPRDPNKQGGYQLDARVSSLEAQARGALIDHAQVANPPAIGDRFLSDVATFQSRIVTPPARTPSTQAEIDGQAIFNRSCAVCHAGAVGSTPETQIGIPRYNDILSGCVRPPDNPTIPGWTGTPRWQFKACPPRLARNIQFYRISGTNPDGTTFTVVRPSSDPGRALTVGVVFNPPPQPIDEWQKFDSAPLAGIANTAPYFHNNSADTLEEVFDHYLALFEFVNANSGGRSPLLFTKDGQSRRLQPSEKGPLVAYLKTL